NTYTYNPRAHTTRSQYIYPQPARMHDPQAIHIHTTRGHTRPAANISNPNPRACTTRSQYIYIQLAGTPNPRACTTRSHYKYISISPAASPTHYCRHIFGWVR